MRGGRAVSAAGRAVRWSARLIGLFIVVLLVVGIGVGINSPEPEEPVYSSSQQSQLDAEDRYRGLAEDARTAAEVQPELAERLNAVASDLDVQADAVSLPRSPAPSSPARLAPSGAPDPQPSGSPADTSATPAATGSPSPSAPQPDAARVLSMLRESALRSLGDAASAEPGAARVLASAGANQWSHAAALGQALGVDPGLPPAASLSPDADADATAGAPADTDSDTDADAGADVGEAVPEGTGSSGQPQTTRRAQDETIPAECAGTPLGSDADRQALLTAKRAEDEARYGYEVAAALLEDRARALALSAEHQAAADATADRLLALCSPAAPAAAGFTISPAFRTDPSLALRELEQDHVSLYAGLVSAVSPSARAWAVTSLNAAVQRSLGAGAVLEPLPGLDDGPSGTQGGPPSSDADQTPDGDQTPHPDQTPDQTPDPDQTPNDAEASAVPADG